jgi:hypothetical protein
MAELALKLRGRCPHCGGAVLVAFRKEMARKNAQLLAAVWHEDDPMPPEWRAVSGFDDVRGFIPLTEEQMR